MRNRYVNLVRYIAHAMKFAGSGVVPASAPKHRLGSPSFGEIWMRTRGQGIPRGPAQTFTSRALRPASHACALILSLACPIVLAYVPLQAEYSKLIQSRSMLHATGTDLFGDRVNLFTGALEFVQEDVSLPGNSALPVAAGRRFVEGHGGEWNVTRGHFGDWDLEIPRIHGVFSQAAGWTVNVGGTFSSQRCSKFDAPPQVLADQGSNSAFTAAEYWHGTFLYLPESGDHEILKRNTTGTRPNSLQPSDGKTYPLVTKADAAIACISINGQSSNEGFRVRTPDGRTYIFNHLVNRDYVQLWKGFPNAVTYSGDEELSSAVPGDYLLNRREYWMLPTEISDRFGNKVIYEWNASVPWRLDQIRGQSTGEPDRLLTFEYYAGTVGNNPPRVQYVHADELGGGAGRRRWEYVYDSLGRLSQVVLPDASTWQFALTSLLSADAGDGGNCDNAAANGLVATGTIVHPSGATGTFTTESIVRTRTWVPRECAGTSADPDYTVAVWPYKYVTRALKTKKLTGIGLPAGGLVWNYGYLSDPGCWGGSGSYPPGNTSFPTLPAGISGCSAGASTTVRTVVADPTGDTLRYTYGNRFHVNEGQLQKVEVLGSAFRTTTMSYAAPEDVNYAWPYPIGSSKQLRGDSYLSTAHTPMTDRVIAQDGVNFSLEVDDFDNRARPIDQTRGSTLAPTLAPMSRTEVTTYVDLPVIWVLGLTETVSVGATTVSDNEYYSTTGNLHKSRQFGSNEQTFEYHTNGTLNKHTDPRLNVTTYTSYKRGVPQSITYADNTTESAEVNDYGLVTSVTDEISATTSYEYDLVGRVKKITQPTGDSVAWNPTNITYTKVAVAEYGFPANHWKRSEITGAFQRDTFYDALWRPILEREYDNTNPGGQGLQRFIRRGYDHAGRSAFASYPETTGSLATPALGTSWTYDALGRLKETQQDSVDGVLGKISTKITYHTGHKKRVTDPRDQSTEYTFQAFDEPSEDRPVKIDQPEDTHTEIKRNIFGNATEIKRKNASGSVVATRSYVYDAYQRLCKSIEPESGATVRDYYADGSLSWVAEGLALPSIIDCSRTSAPAGSRTLHTYDSRNRPQLVNYPSDTSDVSLTYWPDGVLNTTTTEGATWTYGYNKRRLLETESLAFDGQQFLLDWSYNANGARSQLMYPDDAIVAYQPNAFGEATQVGGYVSGIKYHPNRAIDEFTYGNSILHKLTQNDRDLPLRSKDGSVVDYGYQYDKNGNVTQIIDHAQAGMETRTMTYDYLNRLSTVSAAGIWGSAAYTYDQFDNMKTSQVGTRSYAHTIEGATNRLDYVSGTGPTINYDYDVRGNVTLRGAQAFTYDYANRLQSATNVESYDYDGHGRRVRIEKAGGTKTYQVYSRDGELLFGYEPTTDKATKYVYLNGSLVARSDETPGGSLPAPNPLTANPNPNQGNFTVSWTNIGAAEYRLEEMTGAAWAEVYRGPSLNKPFANKPLGEYRYQARGCSVVNSPTSCGAYTTTLLVEVEVGATVITVTPPQSADGSYRASWDPVPLAPYFRLEERIGTGSWTAVTPTPQTATIRDFSGRPQGTYYYKVRACRTTALSSCGDDSNIDSVTVLPPPCAPPTGLATTEPVSYDGTYPLTWTAPAGGCAATYQVRERYAGVTTQYTVSTTSWSTPAAKMKNGEYFYSVASCTTAGACGSPSAELKVTVVRAVSGIPTINPSFMNTNTVYIIDWNGPEGTTGYKVREREITCGSIEAIIDSPNSDLHLVSREDDCSSDISEFQYAISACVGTHCSAYGATANARVVRDNFINALQTTYIHTDALHSPVAETNAAGAVTKRFIHEPYGAPTNGSYEQGPGYTGHVTDTSTGLSYMQQRYYDPLAARFLRIDPVGISSADGQNFNRYWYANNNPYKFIDPDGRASCADKDCKTSTLDSVVPRSNSQPPPVNGTEGLPKGIAQKVNEGYTTTVTFQNDNPNGASPNQPLATKTANMVEDAISKSGVQSVNINSTTGGVHGARSAHSSGRAVDINRVNGQKVNPTNTAASEVQKAARQNSNVRENFGPTIMEKTTVPGGSPGAVTNQALIDAHQNHIHLSGQQ